MMECLNAVCRFQRHQIDKLDDLEAMINRGKIKDHYLCRFAGDGFESRCSLLAGQTFNLGVTEDPAR